MKAAEFRHLLKAVATLPPGQRAELLRVLSGADDESAVAASLSPETLPRCCHCRAETVIRWGRQHGLPRFRCKACKKTFNPLSGTTLAGLKRRDRWMSYLSSLLAGRTLHASAREAGVCTDTAHRWRHRFLAMLGQQTSRQQLAGIVEVDETWVLESFKGQPQRCTGSGREARKRGGTAQRPGRSREQIQVVIARDRSGKTVDAVLPWLDQHLLRTALGPLIQKGSILCSDGHPSYPGFAIEHHLRHEALNASAGEHVREGVYHLQSVNAYHSRLKKFLARFNGVSTAYLESYVRWFRAMDQRAQPSMLLRLVHETDGRSIDV